MEIQLTLQNIMFTLGIVGILFTIYNYFRNPQEAIEKKQILVDREMKNKTSVLTQKEIETEAALLKQKVELENQANDKKFADLICRIDSSQLLAQNHIHTVDTKVDTLIFTVNSLALNMKALETIIDERIPKK